ncbi:MULTISPECIES: LysR family transcriptional regulator [Thalassospira]|uniref:Transcriptional regulator n=2 Tax=Thalassospira TaxID=168934 RepID=A0A367W8T5_9PROT|nr:MULTISPECIES: LysR family transcriptional regulator [Thalassospira]MDG4718043.1 LysR family transcriptional regulator [Thalassospira sp. FZY0004]RCK37823.1 transcriptional regulator [Thalassospira profundimaris]
MSDIRNLDLNLLRALDALLDERNVTRAAEKLALTQPAVSGMLARLRDSFDDPLFVRGQRGMVPTTRALELAVPVKQVLGDIENLLQPASFDPATAHFTVSVAATDYAQRVILVDLMAALRMRAPGIRVALHPVDGGDLVGRFERGEVDLALMTPETAPPDLLSRRLFDERYVVAMRDDHPDRPQGQSAMLALDRFCDLGHALVSPDGGGFYGVTDAVLDRMGRRRAVVLSVTGFLVLPEILRESDLIAVVPERLVKRFDGISSSTPPIDIPGFTKLAVWHERTHRDPRHQWLRQVMFEVCGHLGRRTQD